jgi:hypothetical protein
MTLTSMRSQGSWMASALGTVFVLHGFAHALPGMRATDWVGASGVRSWVQVGIATILWAASSAGLIACGFYLLGVGGFRKVGVIAGPAGIVASALLLTVFWQVAWAMPGLILDAGLIAALLSGEWSTTRSADGRRGWLIPGAATALTGYLLVLILARPWHMRWGSPDAELAAALPGDESRNAPSYQIQHAVTVDAPAAEVWPWLVQLGHDRAGFYSYSRLENLFGLSIRNADGVRPEWQSLRAGDSVFATPLDYLGTGRRFGWRVGALQPDRLLVLEKWGAFVLEPLPGERTRLIVRTRGWGAPSLGSLAAAPLGLTLLEPAHFIMERGMLLGIKERAERSASREQRGLDRPATSRPPGG